MSGIGRGKRALFGAFMILALAIFAELVSWFGLRVLEGSGFSPRALRTQRNEIAGETAQAQAAAGAIAVPRFLTSEVIHPFLGFVFDRDLNVEENRRERRELEITELGFFRDPGPPPERTGRELRIGIFGGSAAFLFSFQGRAALIAALRELPGAAERGIVVDSFALGGFKQPQQLMTLAYLLSLGERFDVVVNLDGFNDVALAMENAEGGVFPFFPRSWPLRVGDLADPKLLEQAGELALLRKQRRSIARFFTAQILERSMSWNLLWRVRDLRKLGHIAALEASFAGYRPADDDYQARGPSFSADSEEALFQDLSTHWARCSLQMDRLCEANGIRYYHVLQPNQYLPGSKPMGEAERAQAFQSDNPYRKAVELGYPRLRKEGAKLREQGVAFFDLTQIFAEEREPIYVDTCCHYNQQGNEKIAAFLAREMLEDPQTVSRGENN